MLASLANYTRTHPRSSTSLIPPNTLQLGAQVVKASKKSRARKRWKQARDMYRQASGHSASSIGSYDMTMQSGRIVTGGRPTLHAMSAKSRGTTPMSAQRS
jgi:hypothetical protein